LLLIVDALRERSRGAEDDEDETVDDETTAFVAQSPPTEDYPDDPTSQIAEVTEESETSEQADSDAQTTAVPAEDDETNRTKTD
jgi:hypothetical protein